VLRGLVLPTGNHAIRFEFHPASYYTGRIIQIVASLIVLVLLVLAEVNTRGIKFSNTQGGGLRLSFNV
jgi:hypothetical protein